jgi:hypothetical protein
MSRKLTGQFETLPVVTEHLPQDVYEWMAGKTANREAILTAKTGRNQPLDMPTVAASRMVQAAMQSKQQASQQRI